VTFFRSSAQRTGSPALRLRRVQPDVMPWLPASHALGVMAAAASRRFRNSGGVDAARQPRPRGQTPVARFYEKPPKLTQGFRPEEEKAPVEAPFDGIGCNLVANRLRKLVGATGFEPATPAPKASWGEPSKYRFSKDLQRSREGVTNSVTTRSATRGC
jgi:hypothetical protein